MTNFPFPFIKLENVSKFYGPTKALDKVNFECNKSEVRAILGENGAGKSTLIKIISGIVQPNNGSLFINNQPIQFKTPKSAIDLGLICMFQELSLIPDLSVEENILLASLDMGFFSSKNLIEAREILDSIGGEDISFKDNIRDLPLSQRQQVEITKALCKKPQLLILDEATSALNVSIVEKVFQLIRSQKEKGVGILFISHRFHEIEQIADNVSVFRDGQHIETFNNGDYSSQEIVNKMIGKNLSHLFPPKSHIDSEQAETVLSVENLSWQENIRNVSFQIKKGQIIGLGGLQGQGQIGLIYALFGLLKSMTGNIKIQDKEIILDSPKKAKSRDIGLALVPEDRKSEGLIPNLSIADNMELALLGLTKLTKKIDNSYCEKFIDQLELVHRSLSQSVEELSGGNQQKIALIKWLILFPNCLLLADPTRGIDVKTKAQIYSLLRELSEEGMSILLLTTDYEELIHLCDEVHIFYNGKIEKSFCNDEITAQNIISASLKIN